MLQAPLRGPHGLFTVSAAPVFVHDSTAVGWAGAFFTDLFAAPEGKVDHGHERYCVQRSCVPIRLREAGSASWRLLPAHATQWLAGEHQHAHWQGGGGRQFLFVATERVDEITDGGPRACGAARQRQVVSPLAGLLLDAMSADLAAGSPAGPLVGDSLVVALVAHLQGATASGASAAAGLAAPARTRVVAFIDEHLSRPITLGELAQVAGVGVRQFCRAFRASMGESPHQYLLRQRVERAKRFIAAGDALADAALNAGFADQSQLNRTFTPRVGLTPAAYRAALRR